MTSTAARPEPGSYYRRALEIIQAAHPGRDAGWQRGQARKAMAAAYDARLKFARSEDIGGGPSYPRTPAELHELEADFKEGEKAKDIAWQTSSPTTESGRYVEAMEVRGIVRLRRGGVPDAPEIYLTKPEWHIFVVGALQAFAWRHA